MDDFVPIQVGYEGLRQLVDSCIIDSYAFGYTGAGGAFEQLVGKGVASMAIQTI